MRILIAEDDPKLLKSLVHIFELNHYAADGVDNGTDAYAYASCGEYDGLVLDVMMPGMNGLTLLKRLREQGVTTPALFLTARSEIEQRIEGLDAGADDYLPKPFSTGELLARVRAMLRRKDHFTPETPFSTRHFTVFFDGSGTVAQTFTESIYSISEDTAIAYAQSALEENNERGWIDSYRYKVFSTDKGHGVAFVDGSMSRSVLIGIIAPVIAVSACIGLSIRQAAESAKTSALELLDSVGLDEDEANRRVLKLSGGQQQRVAIARALSYDPDIILADEPTGNLDRETRAEIMEIFRELATRGKCVILVSHSHEVAELCDERYELVKISGKRKRV